MSQLHSKIRIIRLIHQKTQEEVAEQSFMAVKTYQRKEKGISPISDQDLSKIAQVYNLTVAEIQQFDPAKAIVKKDNPNFVYALLFENGQLKSQLTYTRQILSEIVATFFSPDEPSDS